MDKKSINLCRYLVGLLFVVSFVDKAVRISSITFWEVLPLIGFVLMAASMFSGIYELLAAGAGVQAIPHLFAFVRTLGRLGSENMLVYVIYHILFLAGYALMITSVFRRQSAVKISIFISVLFLVGLAASYIPMFAYSDHPATMVRSAVRSLLGFFSGSCLPVILSGLVLANAPKHRSAKEIPAPEKAASSVSQIDSLASLKTLLDAGAITQEEFDEKKKQILGL